MLWFQWWTSAVSWPLNVGGKPWNSLPAFVPIIFEGMVLAAGLGTVFALLVVARLRPGKKMMPIIPGVMDDRFALLVEETDATFDATAIGPEIDFVLTVRVGVTTLCPCSKAISRHGAHNQRGLVTVQVRSRQAIWIEDLIALVESSASSELYSLLKRQDEKAVTERAYENPVFVEDLVRNAALKLNAHPEVTWYKVEAENFESIHNHNAYACIEKG